MIEVLALVVSYDKWGEDLIWVFCILGQIFVVRMKKCYFLVCFTYKTCLSENNGDAFNQCWKFWMARQLRKGGSGWITNHKFNWLAVLVYLKKRQH